jgi:Putative zinc-finger/HEAT repeats
MECKDYREQFTALLTDSLDQKERNEIEKHLAGCPDCRAEFESAGKIWTLMGEIHQPEPPETMRKGFNTILTNYREELIQKRNPFGEWINRIREYWSLQAQPRLAFSLLLVAVGLIGGYILHQPERSAISYNKQIDSLSSQVSEMKQVMMLSLLQDPSASQRIRAVAYTDEISNVNLKVIGALFTTLNEDPNVNVRLATLEALVKLADEPKVREGLVRSIDLQESPLMQSAIADVMVKLQEKSSVKSLQKLLSKKDLNQMVKINIEKSIQKLI